MAKKQSRTQDLIGLNRFGENGVITDAGVETVWFLVRASNLSVLSPEHKDFNEDLQAWRTEQATIESEVTVGCPVL